MGSAFESKTEELPGPRLQETPWGASTRTFMTSLMNQPTTNYPLQNIVGLSQAEQSGTELLNKLIAGETFQDPFTSPEYAGYRAASLEEEDRAMRQMARRGQRRGVADSSAWLRTEGDVAQSFASDRLAKLGELYGEEMQRNDPLSRVAAAFQYGAVPRQVEQASEDALYNQLLQQYLFPYQYQLPIAQTLLNYQPWYQPQYQTSPSMFSQVASTVAPIAGSVMGLFSGGGGLFSGGSSRMPGSGDSAYASINDTPWI